jgi:hypothetical protein
LGHDNALEITPSQKICDYGERAAAGQVGRVVYRVRDEIYRDFAASLMLVTIPSRRWRAKPTTS